MKRKTGRIQNTIQKLDIFAIPFQFSLGSNEKEKKTLIGGILSLLVVILSLAYFGYLCYLYFANEIQPSIASTSQLSLETFPIEINDRFIAVKITLANGQSLYDFQREKGKTYLNVFLDNSYFDQNNQKNIQAFPLIDCIYEDLKGYLCLDLKQINENKILTLNFTPNNEELNNFKLNFVLCQQQYQQPGQDCADPVIMRNSIVNLGTQIELKIGLQQFNTKDKGLSERIKIEKFFFDSNLAFYSRFVLQKTDISISDGLIIQTSQDKSFISDLARIDAPLSQSYISQQLGYDVLGSMIFYIGSNNNLMQVQYTQFTYLLAQFSSIFNSLLFLGIFSKFFADSELVQEFVELQLKVYYKKTALYILEQAQGKNEVDKERNQGIFNLWKYIQDIDFKKSIKSVIKIGFFYRIKLLLSEGDSKKSDKEADEVKIFKQLIGQSNKALNIFEIQREIMQLKMMIRLLLSVEQYSAMQLCGSKLTINQESNDKQDALLEIVSASPGKDEQLVQNDKITPAQSLIYDNNNLMKAKQIFPLSQKRIDNDTTQIDLDKMTSHLEKIDKIETDQQYFQQCVNKFMIKQSQKPSSEIDKRILECIIGLDSVIPLEEVRLQDDGRSIKFEKISFNIQNDFNINNDDQVNSR